MNDEMNMNEILGFWDIRYPKEMKLHEITCEFNEIIHAVSDLIINLKWKEIEFFRTFRLCHKSHSNENLWQILRFMRKSRRLKSLSQTV